MHLKQEQDIFTREILLNKKELFQTTSGIRINQKSVRCLQYIFETGFPEVTSKDRRWKIGREVKKIIFFQKVQLMNNINSKKENRTKCKKIWSNTFPKLMSINFETERVHEEYRGKNQQKNPLTLEKWVMKFQNISDEENKDLRRRVMGSRREERKRREEKVISYSSSINLFSAFQ